MDIEKRYLFANIRIPIHIKSNGSIEPMKEYISIDFVKCNELPKKPETAVTNDFVMNSIKNILKTDITQNNIGTQTEVIEEVPSDDKKENKKEKVITIHPEEIKHNIKSRINTSFKSNPRPLHRTTQKNR